MTLEICQFQSTVIAKAGYNADRKILVLWFYGFPHVGYEYSDVPPKIWDGLVAAHSKGKFYRYNILGAYSLSQHIIQEEQRSSPSNVELHAAIGPEKLGERYGGYVCSVKLEQEDPPPSTGGRSATLAITRSNFVRLLDFASR